MQIIDVTAAGRVCCPFCGKEAYNSESDEEVSQTCPHLLFHAFTGSDMIDVMREDVADEDGELFDLEALGIQKTAQDAEGDDQDGNFDDDLSLGEIIERAQVPNAVCFEVVSPCKCHSSYIAFCLDEDLRKKD